MSYDLNFWKYKENVYLDNQSVYEALSDRKEVEGLEDIPVDEIRQKIAEAFSDWNRVDIDSFEKEAKGAFQVITTTKFVRIDCYGMKGEDMNKFIDILDEYNCPLYDPQVMKRFDNHQ